ncbi:hypothetical protein CPB84DRAFT_96183 [Gymnopilus junonius]|uniref:Uncharacterized protein n=1 Tax=Gymnopilus junonius TaxID=109634 RepID=A0A9P5TS65_GYMJU|nr:hypothetical protein CPB84DRAFT_96183 [Gymnopilus junonius]
MGPVHSFLSTLSFLHLTDMLTILVYSQMFFVFLPSHSSTACLTAVGTHNSISLRTRGVTRLRSPPLLDVGTGSTGNGALQLFGRILFSQKNKCCYFERRNILRTGNRAVIEREVFNVKNKRALTFKKRTLTRSQNCIIFPSNAKL